MARFSDFQCCIYADLTPLKVPFFQKVGLVFQISQSQKRNIPKKYPELEIEIPAHISKQLIQISSLG